MPLIVIVLFSVISYFLDLQTKVSIIGNEIKPGLPSLKAPNFEYIGDVWHGAVIIAIVSYMGSIALAKEFEQKKNEDYKRELNEYNEWYNNRNDNDNDNDQISHKKEPVKPLQLASIKVSPNMEFIAYGMANMLGCFFSGMIVSGSFSRSALKYEMNACTQVASGIQAFICLMCLLFLMPLLAPLPKCVLAAVVTISVYRLIKNGINEFRFLLR